MEEVRAVVFSMNPNSAPGPDAFFSSHTMPRYMTQACLVLLPKVEFPSSLSEYRPISLSNFINKIISKLICSRISTFLPKMISPNQTGFVKGRSISENIMLAQEIVQGIKKPNIGANVVIKLDMAKAYDRVSWSFTCIILRRLGFSELLIDMVWRTLSNNWYSVIVNGTRCGFFHSTRGLKQGDPLAPALFILGAELLSRMLNNLTHDQFFNGFYMERRGPQITHLSFADDIIIFTSGSTYSLQKIMDTLQSYENTSGQLINKNKSHFMTSSSAFPYTIRRIKQITGFTRKESPLTYLGCPLYTGRKRTVHFNPIVSKVVGRIRGWHGKLLSYGGRATLIKHVLQSIPIHLLSAVSPPKTVLRQIEKLAANFFWGMDSDKNKYHWASWQQLSNTLDEGGVGFKSIEHVCRSLELKQWWWFRTKQTLWSSFLKAKYCQRSHPVQKKWDSGQSQTWKKLMSNKKEAEPHIQWILHSGSSSFWWDNWLGSGNLASFRQQRGRPGNIKVSSLWSSGSWDIHKLNNLAPPHMIQTIIQTPIHFNPLVPDKPIWTPTASGDFTCASAWHVIRQKKPKLLTNTLTWHKRIPFKWSFCLWRALRNKLPTDARVARFSNPTVSKCVCCIRPGFETVDHLFSTGHFAKTVWKIYAAPMGIQINPMPLSMLIVKWGLLKRTNLVHKLKNRCSSKYGSKNSSLSRTCYSIETDINLLLKATYGNIHWPIKWPDTALIIENLSHQVRIYQVAWGKPASGVVKVNTDGSALGNPGKIGAGIIIRDHNGNFIHAISSPLGEGTNNQAETQAAHIGIMSTLQITFWGSSHWLTLSSPMFNQLREYPLKEIDPPWSNTYSHMQHNLQILDAEKAEIPGNHPSVSVSGISISYAHSAETVSIDASLSIQPYMHPSTCLKTDPSLTTASQMPVSPIHNQTVTDSTFCTNAPTLTTAENTADL
ncbi:PREDICTED: uncharacterized protein LOC109205994 [Nicotiana attenuata]|uniref:uncharacterized protein LOC109205994 n=1 Tax=Nicotiana attenuata TaxID=49451 RepID=UPI000905427C|nr:PREDICTED: uncharacterized protein LOC109205994 [Nicotiana attenuata]